MICPNCKHPVRMEIDPEKKKKIRALYKKGYSCRDIAALLLVSASTVSRLMRQK